MKKIVKLALLFFWLTALITPSVFSILDLNDDLVVTTVSEEEPTEQEKKDPSEETEEKIVHENTSDFAIVSYFKKSSKKEFYFADYSDYKVEIHLPPPEHFA